MPFLTDKFTKLHVTVEIIVLEACALQCPYCSPEINKAVHSSQYDQYSFHCEIETKGCDLVCAESRKIFIRSLRHSYDDSMLDLLRSVFLLSGPYPECPRLCTVVKLNRREL